MLQILGRRLCAMPSSSWRRLSGPLLLGKQQFKPAGRELRKMHCGRRRNHKAKIQANNTVFKTLPALR